MSPVRWRAAPLTAQGPGLDTRDVVADTGLLGARGWPRADAAGSSEAPVSGWRRVWTRPSSPRWWAQLACRRAAQEDCGESPSSGRAGGGSHGLSRCLPPCLAPGVQITWTGAGPVALRQNLLLVSLLTGSLTHFLTVCALCQALGRGRRPAAGRCLSLPLPYGARGGGEAGRKQVVAAAPRRPGGVKEGLLTRPGGWGRVPDPLMRVGLGVERRWGGGPRRGMCSDS